MTVQELIDELQKVEDKGLEVKIDTYAFLDCNILSVITDTYSIEEPRDFPEGMPAGFYIETAFVDRLEAKEFRLEAFRRKQAALVGETQ